jgi:YD repeat-containing protein
MTRVVLNNLKLRSSQKPRACVSPGCSSLATILLVIACGAMRVSAQSPTDDTGFQPNRDYLALQPFESFDTASGNLILTFTDLELPANGGRMLRFTRVFNNRVTDTSYLHWRFSINGLPMQINQPDIPSNAVIDDSVAGNQEFAPSLLMADGSVQRTTFVAEPHPDNHPTIVWVSTPSFWLYNRDTRTLYVPDGTVAQYDGNGRLQSFADTFGNTTALNWQTGQLVVTQYLGAGQSRQVVLAMDDATQLPTQMTYEGRVWTYAYEPGQAGLLRTVQVPVLSGSLLGKALEPLASGEGEILVLLTLQ